MRKSINRFGPFGIGIGAVLAGWMSVAVAADVPKFEVDPFWPKPLPNNWALGQVGGLAVDERDHVWIIHRPASLSPAERAASFDPPRAKCCVPAPPIIEFDPQGNVVQAWGGPGQGYDWPKREHGIRVAGKTEDEQRRRPAILLLQRGLRKPCVVSVYLIIITGECSVVTGVSEQDSAQLAILA